MSTMTRTSIWKAPRGVIIHRRRGKNQPLEVYRSQELLETTSEGKPFPSDRAAISPGGRPRGIWLGTWCGANFPAGRNSCQKVDTFCLCQGCPFFDFQTHHPHCLWGIFPRNQPRPRYGNNCKEGPMLKVLSLGFLYFNYFHIKQSRYRLHLKLAATYFKAPTVSLS